MRKRIGLFTTGTGRSALSPFFFLDRHRVFKKFAGDPFLRSAMFPYSFFFPFGPLIPDPNRGRSSSIGGILFFLFFFSVPFFFVRLFLLQRLFFYWGLWRPGRNRREDWFPRTHARIFSDNGRKRNGGVPNAQVNGARPAPVFHGCLFFSFFFFTPLYVLFPPRGRKQG